MDIDKDHILHSESGKFTQDTTSKQDDVTRILNQAILKQPSNGLVLHFHGGLNSQKVGREIAARLVKEYSAADTYPVFFVWESGLIESIANNLREIPKDKPFQELVKKVSEWVLKKTEAQIVTRGGAGQLIDEVSLRKEYDRWFDQQRDTPPVPEDPAAYHEVKTRSAAPLSEDELAQDIADGLDNDPQFQKVFQDLGNRVSGPTPAGQALVQDATLDTLYPKPPGGVRERGVISWLLVGKFVAKLVIAVLKRYSNDRDHGFYCTVVEEVLRSAYLDLLGSTIWNQMKHDTANSFDTGSDYCGSRFVKELAALAEQGKAFPKITLIGHSTGAIYICEFLDAVAKEHALAGQQFDIIFLAPAVKHTRFAKALQAHAGRIANFRMYAMKDDLEAEDSLVPVLYTRSLLYFVSGLLEGEGSDSKWQAEVDAPIVGMQRYLAQSDNYGSASQAVEKVRQYLEDKPGRAVWSEVDGGPGLNSRARKHGDFDNEERTVESVKVVLSQGY